VTSVGLLVNKYARDGFAFQVRARTCHSAESARTLVVDQSLCTFFLLIGVPPIECLFSNLASLYKLISRGKRNTSTLDFIGSEALVEFRWKL